MKYQFKRSALKEVSDFCLSQKPGFVYLRGRRRIGKSWILDKIQSRYPKKVFHFSGNLDQNNKETVSSFIAAWEKFSKQKNLSVLKEDYLSWSRIFEEISNYAKSHDSKIVIALDEIQWIATGRSGFIGSLKNIWVDWEKRTQIKVIVCGSSNRFFSKFVGGETKILRGMQTRSSIWINELSLGEIRRGLLKNWSSQEVALTYMLLGGIPYYLNQLEPELGFIKALNQALFCKTTIFLDEWREVLAVDFNKTGLKSALEIFSALISTHSSGLAEIAKILGKKSEVVRDFLNKLIEYGYIEESPVRSKKLLTKRGSQYQINDFYLQTYFSLLKKNELFIKNNTDSIIFPHLAFSPLNSFYIPGLTGKAFEMLVAKTLGKDLNLGSSLAKKLRLPDYNFIVLRNILESNSQIDVMLVHMTDRITRVIECKWSAQEETDHLDQALDRTIPTEIDQINLKNYATQCYLAVSYKPSERFLNLAQNKNISIITLEDLCTADLRQ